MAKRRVSAYFMNDQEKARAAELMGQTTETEGFFLGEVEEDVIPKLESAGLIVQSYPDSWTPAEPPKAKPSPMAAARMTREAAINEMDINPAPRDYYRVALSGPVLEAWRQELQAMGIELGEALQGGGYRVRLQLADVPRVRALPFVASADWIQPAASAPVTVTQSVGLTAPVLKFDIRLNDPDSSGRVQDWLKARNVTILGAAGRKIRIEAAENAPELNDLATLPEVDLIAEYVEPTPFNDVARIILELDELVNSPAGGDPTVTALLDQDGAGQIVAVADTGLDAQHEDFKDRIVAVIARGRQTDSSDPHGHGTHVAGSVLGDGAASGGKIRGTAPRAKLVFQSLLDAKGGLGGLPLDLNDLFQEAYKLGARIHNDSWGARMPSTYTMNSEEVDEFVRKNPDMLVVIAAGNDGSSAKNVHAPTGFVDWLSIGSPASCKNALTVGACRSNRSDGSPVGKNCWGGVWPGDFPDDPIKSQEISGDPEFMAAFSSRGPIDDHRIKPDVVAPGTDILSTLSSTGNIGRFWGPGAPKYPRYAYDGGTSMATPLVSGGAALVRQYYADVCKHQPSAALLKATLINSTVWMSGADALADPQGTPNFHQGFGRISMSRAIPNKKNPQFAVQFLDDWQQPQKSLSRTGERRRYFFTLPANLGELRFCLAYTDAPARALQNNINLIVQHADSGTKWVGNAKLPDSLTTLDTTNNVESIRIDNAPAGNYFVQIVASNILKPPQDFALVVSGNQVPALNPLT